jgi:hypothetical protein
MLIGAIDMSNPSHHIPPFPEPEEMEAAEALSWIATGRAVPLRAWSRDFYCLEPRWSCTAPSFWDTELNPMPLRRLVEAGSDETGWA